MDYKQLKAKWFAKVKLAWESEPGWETQAESGWSAQIAVVAWLGKLLKSLPQNTALVWPAGEEPEVLRTWDLYSLDDYDYVALIPPNSCHRWCEEEGAFGGYKVQTLTLPNEWEIRVGYHG